jgi:hypothetical protein
MIKLHTSRHRIRLDTTVYVFIAVFWGSRYKARVTLSWWRWRQLSIREYHAARLERSIAIMDALSEVKYWFPVRQLVPAFRFSAPSC